MDSDKLIEGLDTLRVAQDSLYIEVGTHNNYRAVSFDTTLEKWTYSDGRHQEDFVCLSFADALECLISPPCDGDWESQIREGLKPK